MCHPFTAAEAAAALGGSSSSRLQEEKAVRFRKKINKQHPQGTLVSSSAKAQAQIRRELLGASLGQYGKSVLDMPEPVATTDDVPSGRSPAGFAASLLGRRVRTKRSCSKECPFPPTAPEIQEKKDEVDRYCRLVEAKMAALNEYSVAEPEDWMHRALRQDELDPELRSRTVFALARRLARRKGDCVSKNHISETFELETRLLQDREYLLRDPLLALELAYLCRDGLGLSSVLDAIFTDLERHASDSIPLPKVPAPDSPQTKTRSRCFSATSRSISPIRDKLQVPAPDSPPQSRAHSAFFPESPSTSPIQDKSQVPAPDSLQSRTRSRVFSAPSPSTLSPRKIKTSSKLRNASNLLRFQQRLANVARECSRDKLRRQELLVAEGIEDTPRFRAVLDGVSGVESRLAELAEKQCAATLQKGNPYRNIFVDIAEWHRERGDTEKGRRFMEYARSVPGEERDPRSISRFYTWHFPSSPDVPDDNPRFEDSSAAPKRPVKRALGKCSHGCTRELYGRAPCVGHPRRAANVAKPPDLGSPLGSTFLESVDVLRAAVDLTIEVDVGSGGHTSPAMSAVWCGSSDSLRAATIFKGDSDSLRLSTGDDVPEHMRRVIDRTFNTAPAFAIGTPSACTVNKAIPMDESTARLVKVSEAARQIVTSRRFKVRVVEHLPNDSSITSQDENSDDEDVKPSRPFKDNPSEHLDAHV